MADQIGQKVIIPDSAPFALGGKIGTITEIRKSQLGMADVVTVVTADGSLYFDRDYQFTPA